MAYPYVSAGIPGMAEPHRNIHTAWKISKRRVCVTVALQMLNGQKQRGQQIRKQKATKHKNNTKL